MEVEGDNRPFVTVDVMGLKVTGLLDSGAQVSILGAGGDLLLRKLNLREFGSKRKLFSAGGDELEVYIQRYNEAGHYSDLAHAKTENDLGDELLASVRDRTKSNQ